MKVIMGLGNPGVQYEETRHNIGFLLIDLIAEVHNLQFRSKFQGLVAEGQIEGERLFLLKPQTFMNLSGRSVAELIKFYKIPLDDLLIVQDDMDLPLGKLRLRDQGSAGGHNGIKSIQGELGSEKLWRLKLGVGRPPKEWDPARYVLAPFSDDESQMLDDVLERAEKASYLWIKEEYSRAMNLYHR
ncbi:aminoacyl-tRNA hydrolase [Desulfosporosinus meridiei]|uniref:Peptidyl-tRNA hydrolase n=1 Tax=Desulfosporosinus meridiei (strain ATCC BAA-275 / DSM 13257 / KCTC 12902 / NCIMB 13706 / S10) TaxID=768704 RepID=J7IK71_DESMD|nr:aminoacyl-tRNA hydrolase [Desulfosporosinus meridiei]AFQ42162.1 peptidyl-tRNA hydrolase [Desulfosporosinus meridiei DSM 13257]